MSVTKRLSVFLGKTPTFGDDVYIASTAVVVGDVRIGSRSSVWYNAVLRGDINYISIGEDTNIQYGVLGHLADDFPLIVGNKLQSDMEPLYMRVRSKIVLDWNECHNLDGAMISKIRLLRLVL